MKKDDRYSYERQFLVNIVIAFTIENEENLKRYLTLLQIYIYRNTEQTEFRAF